MKTMDNKPKNEDFVQLPRKIKHAYMDGKLTKSERDVLIWIWLGTNPYNGTFSTTYDGLRRELSGEITNDNIRKIVSRLRKAQYIYFSDHRGRSGPFYVYPVDFQLTSKAIQTWAYLQKNNSVTIPSQPTLIQEGQQENNLPTLNHNPQEQKTQEPKVISTYPQNPKITTTYNDNDDENHIHKIDDTSMAFKERKETPKATKPIPVETFGPKTKEELICQDIAKWLGEKDMRPIFKLLNQYGFFYIEKAWGLIKEDRTGKIENKGGYFTRTVQNLYKDAHK